MKTLARFFLFLSLPLVVLGQVADLSPEEKRTLELSPGVVFIREVYKVTAAIPQPGTRDAKILEGQLGASGTGFIYRPDGYIITNAHVVADANLKDQQAQQGRLRTAAGQVLAVAEELNQRRMTDEEKQFIFGHISLGTPVIQVSLNNKTTYVGEIKLYSDPTGVNVGKDVAIIKVDANNLPTVQLGNSDDVHVQEPTTVIGYPGAASALGASAGKMISTESLLVPTVTNGHISAVKMDYKGTPVLQSDAAITHGNSGGPAFDPQGRVIGIATYGAVEASGFNFFVPINTAMEFVRQAGAPPQQGSFDKIWREALDAFTEHKWKKAHALLTDVLSLMPNEPDALRLQPIAAEQARNEGFLARTMEDSGSALFIGGVVVALVVIGLAVWFFTSKKSTSIPVAAPAMAGGAPASFSPQIRGSAPLQATAVPVPMPVPAHASGPDASYGAIHITAGPLTGNRFPVTKAGLLIGRDSTKCNVVLPDDNVSKEHAWIVPIDQGVVVIDRNSSNGTYVNSTESPRINKVGLKNGDRVFIGKNGTVLTYFNS